MTSLYHLRSGPAGTYRITKLDADYSIEASYLVSKHECTCPAGARGTCRHRQMLPFFLAKAHIDNGWMLDWHTRQWRKPLCEDGREQPIDDQSGLSIASEDGLGEARSKEDLAPTAEPNRSQDLPDNELELEEDEDGFEVEIENDEDDQAVGEAIEEPVPPIDSSLEAEVERPRGPRPAPSASTQIKRRKI